MPCLSVYICFGNVSNGPVYLKYNDIFLQAEADSRVYTDCDCKSDCKRSRIMSIIDLFDLPSRIVH